MTTAELHKLGFTVIGNKAVRIADAKPAAQAVTRRTIKRFIYATIVSEANQGGKLRAKISRKMAQKRAVAEAFGTELLNAGRPKRVTFVLLTSQPLDDDNLASAFKRHRDQIARSCGFDDKERVWKYRQEKRRSFEPRGCWIMVEFA